ncbi:MAG TPA: Na+/H+ antiporter NhaA [Microbacteriaceae bacterium]|nr:Na+/H+ antiporter NhaA [Microbacteriaceae bacterium]
MSFLRSERVSAVLLLAAAVAGLLVANSPAGHAVEQVMAFEFGWTVHAWIEDGLLALFFLVVTIELRHEFTNGELRTPALAARPAIAAGGGILVPVAIYLAFTVGTGQEGGWPIPTATDIAFALGVLAIAGRGLLPQRVRAFLLALAIIDDLVGILIIAVLFGADPHRLPTLAAVAIGALLPARWGHAVRRTLEPTVNGLVLPLFAFAACLVVLPQVSGGLAPAFWGIAVALPVGKLVGIAGATWIADRVLTRQRRRRMTFLELTSLGALGGIGFTVSLLLASLAFAGQPELRAEAIVAVLVGSIASIGLAVVLLSVQASRYRALARLRAAVRDGAAR